MESALLWRLFLAVLQAGERHGAGEALLRCFEFWLLRIGGVLPDYGSCSHCGRCVKDDEFYARAENGVGRCRDCAGGRGIHVRPAAAKLLGKLLKESPEKFIGSVRDQENLRDLEILAQRLLGLHIEKPIKSYREYRKVSAAGGASAE